MIQNWYEIHKIWSQWFILLKTLYNLSSIIYYFRFLIFKNYNAIHNVLTRKLRMPPSTHLCFSAQYVFSQRSVFDSSRALKFSIHTSLHKLFCLLLLRTEDGPKHCCRKSIGNSINAQMRNDHGGCEFLILPSIKRIRAHSMKYLQAFFSRVK